MTLCIFGFDSMVLREVQMASFLVCVCEIQYNTISISDCANKQRQNRENIIICHLTYISSDNEFAGGRFIVSMAMPKVSSTVPMTRSLPLAAAVEKRNC